jgi:hypothetical protein
MHPAVIPNEVHLGSGLVSKSRLLPLAKSGITAEIASTSGQEYVSNCSSDNSNCMTICHARKLKIILYISIGIEIFLT